MFDFNRILARRASKFYTRGVYYYEVLVASQTYHGEDPLTYSSELDLLAGSIVKVELRAKAVLGIVLRRVTQPDFKVKPIAAATPYPPLPPQHMELLRWLHVFYPAPLGTVVRQFVPPTLAEQRTPSEKITEHTKTEVIPYASPELMPSLTADQQRAVDTIDGAGTFLLHGITGSGKSRVYVELATRVLRNGRSALILTPEIGLTTQLAASFRQVFGENVFVLHSQLTAAERRNSYYELLTRNEPSIVIGPRSSLFSPLHDIGLIVLDEAHDNAYKNESAPHYQSGRVAAKLASLHSATLVLGSATPSVEDYYLAQVKDRPIVAMDELAKSALTPLAIEIIDRRKPELFSRSPLISDSLLTHISRAMQHGEQSLIFLNRRGTANVVLCSSCGWQSLCPNCDLSLTYHGDTHEMRCHVCGFTTALPISCPVCGSTDILFKSIGTKAIVDALHKLFPTARIQRFDTDAKKADRLEQHLERLADGSADIIVGTQMVGKGLDLPKLSVVGVVNADSSLLIPDYTAAEQTYQLLVQVVGRVGRGHRPGTVVIQTYDPDNTTLRAAVSKDWEAFYRAELDERKLYRFPPFVHLLKLYILRASSKSAENAATSLAESLTTRYPRVNIEGPAPSFHPRDRGKYSWQLLVKASDRQSLLAIIRELPTGWSYDIDPANLL